MPMRRENVAAALRYLQDKADLRGRLQRATSLDPQEQDLADIAVETGASLVPGVGPALAARDFERARRANDPAGMAMAAAGAIPGGKLAKLLKGFDPTRLELDVYHGTPHQFPATEANPLGEFDASKIGTGEGQQVYGHGIYLAEAQDVGDSYRRALTPHQVTSDAAQSLANYAIRQRREPEAAIQWLEKERKAYKEPPPLETMKQYDDAIAILRQGNVEKVGNLYKADLPDEMIDRMLDWDKPLSKDAPQAVKDAFNKLAQTYPDLKEKLFAAYREGQPGSHYYSLLNDYAKTGDLVKNQTFASDAMRQAGIPGIKYLDAGSRGQGGSGTRNFVVFPGEEKKVRILERDGQKAPPQKIARALEAAPDYRMTHRPMSDAGGASRLHNAYESFGEDIYGPKALQYFGAGDPREAKVVAALKRLRDNPDAEVTIYRGVPKDAAGEIGKGDWVTLDRSVAAEYGDKVLTKKVKAKDITTWPDSLLEFGYYPEN